MVYSAGMCMGSIVTNIVPIIRFRATTVLKLYQKNNVYYYGGKNHRRGGARVLGVSYEGDTEWKKFSVRIFSQPIPDPPKGSHPAPAHPRPTRSGGKHP